MTGRLRYNSDLERRGHDHEEEKGKKELVKPSERRPPPWGKRWERVLVIDPQAERIDLDLFGQKAQYKIMFKMVDDDVEK